MKSPSWLDGQQLSRARRPSTRVAHAPFKQSRKRRLQIEALEDRRLLSMTDLNPPGWTYSEATCINDASQVVIEVSNTVNPGPGTLEGGTPEQPLLYSNGTVTDLGTLPGWPQSVGTGMNNLGQVVGYCGDTSGNLIGWLYSNGTMTALGAANTFIPLGINDSGQMAGYIGSPYVSGTTLPALWQNGQVTRLPDSISVGGIGDVDSPGCINDRGQVVGTTQTASGVSEACLWQNGTVTDLGLSGNPVAINASGEVVGFAYTNTTGGVLTFGAWLWQNGTTTDLGTLPGCDRSEAIDINGSGQVVGTSSTSSNGVGHACLWQENGTSWTITDLGTLGGVGSVARAINDEGQVVGQTGIGGGIGHAFLWTPDPSVSIVTPSAGPLTGGTTVTITGADLGGATAVDFGGTPGTIVSNTATQIVVTSPATTTAGTVDITVINPDGTSATSSADQFTYAPPMTVSAADWTSAGLTLTLATDGDLHVYTTGTTTDAVPPVAPTSVSSIDITSPSDTTANLTIDSTAGDPIPAGGLDYSGAGGLIITGSGTVALSGTNTYTGGTTISSDRLLIKAASALPGGTSLTVDAGGTFTFDPSVAAANVTAAASIVRSANSAGVISGTTADTSGNLPVSAAARVWSSAATTHPDSLTNPATNPNSGTSADAALLQPLGRQDVDVVIARQYARDLAWLAAGASSSRSGEQGQTKDHAIQALDALLAQYGV